MAESITTELEIVPHKIGAPRKVQVHQMQIQNFHMHTCLTHLARMLTALIKGTSNNSNSELIPRDISAFRTSWAAYLATFQFALDHNNPPQVGSEFDYQLLVPTKFELQALKNAKVKQVALHIDRLIEVFISSDSATSNGNIGIQTQSDLETQNRICEAAIDLWFGTGADNSVAGTGIVVPVFKQIGRVVAPDFDMDEANVREYDPSAPVTGRPDVGDLPITGD